jgi:hypothetical protein
VVRRGIHLPSAIIIGRLAVMSSSTSYSEEGGDSEHGSDSESELIADSDSGVFIPRGRTSDCLFKLRPSGFPVKSLYVLFSQKFSNTLRTQKVVGFERQRWTLNQLHRARNGATNRKKVHFKKVSDSVNPN